MTKKILAVDDEPDMLDIVAIMLENSGYEVLKAQDAEKALTMIDKGTPDLILLDLHLPGMQGEEFCKSLKSDDHMKKIPIILFSVSSQGMYTRTKDIGADDFIVKPFSAEQILMKIKKFIGT
jgi:DNA-binding response OmpR family regulator